MSGTKKAAKKGFIEAQIKMGTMHEKGQGVLQIDEEAVRWFRMAAREGSAEGQFRLGMAYETGRGVLQQNNKEARKWYSRAALQGYIPTKKEVERISVATNNGIPYATRNQHPCRKLWNDNPLQL